MKSATGNIKWEINVLRTEGKNKRAEMKEMMTWMINLNSVYAKRECRC
jgi:hypothetical protein